MINPLTPDIPPPPPSFPWILLSLQLFFIQLHWEIVGCHVSFHVLFLWIISHLAPAFSHTLVPTLLKPF